MKVLHLRSSAFFGSPERLILGQAAALRGRVSSEVAVLPDGEGDDFMRAASSAGVPVHVLPAGKLPFRAVWRLARLLRRNRYDVLCTHDYKSNLVGRAASFFAPCRQVAVFHGRTGRSRLYEGIDDRLLRAMPAVVAVSQATAGRLSFLGGRVRVIRNALDPGPLDLKGGPDLRREWGLGDGDVLFAAAGRLSPEKGYPVLLDAFARFLSRRKNVFLALAGDGPDAARLARDVGDRGLEKNVRLTGFLRDLSPLYRAMDAFVISSHTEGLPLVALESAHFSKPVVSTDVGGVGEAVKDGVSGLLVPAGDPGALADAMERLAADGALRARLGAGGRDALGKEFSVEAHAAAYQALYEELAAPRLLWISWERHRRTRELARDLGAPLVEIDARLPRLVKHPWFLARTFLVLLRRRPEVLIIQCPSVVLGAWAAALKPVFRCRLVMDAHNEAVSPTNFRFALYLALVRFLHRAADRTIVTNGPLRAIVEANGGRALVLPDKVPSLPPAPPPPRRPAPRAVFICTFASDEPFVEVIEAARLLGGAVVELAVTGNPRKAGALPPLPPNARLTGFLPEEEYLALLREADVLVDLTTREDCLVCGGYEAAALGKPIVLSDTAALRGYFRRGAVYARPDRASLAAAIREALRRRDELAREMGELRGELAADWALRRRDVMDFLGRRES